MSPTLVILANIGGSSKKVCVTPSSYEFYGSEETASGLSCGWHYDPDFHTDLDEARATAGADFLGIDVGMWNEFRPAGYQIHPFSYQHRYPAGFEAPYMTGELSGGGSYGVGTAGATPTMVREKGTVDDSELKLKSEDAGYPKIIGCASDLWKPSRRKRKEK